MRSLHATSIDLVLSDYPAPAVETRTTYSRSFLKIPIFVFGNRNFRHLRKGFPQSLEGQPFIVPTHHSKLRHDLDHYFQAQKLNVEMIVETQDSSIQKLLALKGMGLFAAPVFFADTLGKGTNLENLGALQGVNEEFWLISARRILDNPIATEIIENFSFSMH